MSARLARAIRIVRRLLVAIVLFIALFPPLHALVVPEERGGVVALPMPPEREYRVLVADWGYHTAIVIEQPPGWSLGPPGEEQAPYLEYAWGDRRFYMESDYRPQAIFATLVLPTSAVLYLDARPAPLTLRGARAVYERTVDAATLHTLLLELERSFVRDSAGRRLASFAPVAGYLGRFHRAHGRYLWARDCNWWTVTRLRAAGLARSGVGVIFSGQVHGRLEGFRP